jgi:hypothetical protein
MMVWLGLSFGCRYATSVPGFAGTRELAFQAAVLLHVNVAEQRHDSNMMQRCTRILLSKANAGVPGRARSCLSF